MVSIAEYNIVRSAIWMRKRFGLFTYRLVARLNYNSSGAEARVRESRQPWAIFQFPFFLGKSIIKDRKPNIFGFLNKFICINLNIFWHLARDTLFGGCLGPQFSTHFSIIKTEEMKHYSGGGQNLEQLNLERPIFRILKELKMNYSISLFSI